MTDTTVSDAVVFPQDDGTGIADGKEDFLSAGYLSLLSKYEGDGSYVGQDTSGNATLQFANVDTTNEQVDVQSGFAYIMESGKTVQSASQNSYDTTLPNDAPYVVILPTNKNNLGLGTDTSNDLWLAFDPSKNESVYIRHGSGLSAPNEPSVKLGTVNTSDGSTTRANDKPSPSFSAVQTDQGTITSLDGTSLQYDSVGVSDTVQTTTDRFQLYVRNSGDDANDGLTASTPLKTISKAIEKVSVLGNERGDGSTHVINLGEGETYTADDIAVVLPWVGKLFITTDGANATIEVPNSANNAFIVVGTRVVFNNMDFRAASTSYPNALEAHGGNAKLDLLSGVTIKEFTNKGVEAIEGPVVDLDGCTITGDGKNQSATGVALIRGAHVKGSNANTRIEDCNVALWVDQNSSGLPSQWTIDNCDTGIRSEDESHTKIASSLAITNCNLALETRFSATLQVTSGSLDLTGTTTRFESVGTGNNFQDVPNNEDKSYFDILVDGAGVQHSGELAGVVTRLSMPHHFPYIVRGVGSEIVVRDNIPKGMAFNSDGTKMFIAGSDGDVIEEWDLSTAYDVSTASYSTEVDISTNFSDPTGVAFNGDGTKMFVTGEANQRVGEYDLSTGYDVSTASHNSNLDVSGDIALPNGLAFDDDGNRMYVIDRGAGNDVTEYALSIAYDVSTASLTDTLGIGTEDTAMAGIVFSDDGEVMFLCGSGNVNIYRYTLSTAFDVSTATHQDTFNVSSVESVPAGLELNGGETDLYLVGAGNDKVYQYVS